MFGRSAEDRAKERARIQSGPAFSDDVAYVTHPLAYCRDSSINGAALAGLDSLIRSLRPIPTDTICHRLVLTHLDLGLGNMLTAGGRLNAVIDWEFHGVTPLYLSAVDLPWLRYDGYEDAGRFAPIVPTTGLGLSIWLERRADADRFIANFRKGRLTERLSRVRSRS